jgi:mono/diheme cytochrome c family protein
MVDPRKRRVVVIAAGLAIAGAAYASPWDIDMIDAYTLKAFEWKMRQAPTASVQRQPEGPRGVGAYQTAWVAQVDRTNSAQVDAMVNPFPADEARLAEGKRLFQVTCAPCHGVDGKGGGPVTNHNPAQGLNRFQLPAPVLSGAAVVSAGAAADSTGGTK